MDEVLNKSPHGLFWRPIESAPQDGRDVLLYFPLDGLSDTHKRVIICYWHDRLGAWVWQDRAVRGYSWAYAPTHWMPLPEEPAQGIEARQGGDANAAPSQRDESPVAEGDAPELQSPMPPNPIPAREAL